jgi:hypothetical protein
MESGDVALLVSARLLEIGLTAEDRTAVQALALLLENGGFSGRDYTNRDQIPVELLRAARDRAEAYLNGLEQSNGAGSESDGDTAA